MTTLTITLDQAKAMATRLREAMSGGELAISHSQALELVAKQLGHRDWNTCHAALAAASTNNSSDDGAAPLLVPILRTFPGGEARDFYCGYLGFRVDWEHRFEPGLPLYQQVSRGGCVLHLSEHHGDGTPGSVVRIAVCDLRRLHRQLHASGYPLRPGIEEEPWGLDMEVPDPFGNRLVFHQSEQPPANPAGVMRIE
jgi:catechol 2,3-dioxygenase-like lactoylglutathione lyase family enzyme